MRCIICGEEQEPTPEHIVPQALGNKQLITHQVCMKCNSTLGHKIDSYFVNHQITKCWRNSNQILLSKSKTVHAFNGLITEHDGVKYILKDNSVIIPLIPKKINGGYSITSFSKDITQAKSVLKKALKRESKLNGTACTQEDIEKSISNAKISSHPIEKVEFPFSYDIDFLYFDLEYIKIAYEFAFLTFNNDYWDDIIQAKYQTFLSFGMNYDRNCIRKFINYSTDIKPLVFHSNHYTEQLLPHCRDALEKDVLHFLMLIRVQNTIWCQISLCSCNIYHAIIKVSENADRYKMKYDCVCMCVLDDGSYESFYLKSISQPANL